MKTKLSIGSLALGDAPLVVGVISTPLTIDRIASGFRPSCDVAEFRADLFGVDTPDWLLRAQELERDGMPVVLTIRHTSEGGHWFRSEDERATIYRQAMPFVSAVDAEIRSASFADIAAAARESGRLLIGSFHDFHGMPASSALLATIDEGRARGAHVVKIAAIANEEADLLCLESLLAKRSDVRLSVLGMGPMGPESRVRLARAGSCLTYGFVDEANAPGQLSSEELQKRLVAQVPGYSVRFASGIRRAE